VPISHCPDSNKKRKTRRGGVTLPCVVAEKRRTRRGGFTPPCVVAVEKRRKTPPRIQKEDKEG
jgi:hypothetical protein